MRYRVSTTETITRWYEFESDESEGSLFVEFDPADPNVTLLPGSNVEGTSYGEEVTGVTKIP